MFEFTLTAQNNRARTGTFTTPHGILQTPVFAPVGTMVPIKALPWNITMSLANRKVAIPPLKCQGIKTKLVDWILDHVSSDDDGTWIEPFMGSGVVGFNVRPHRAIFNDINPHIINLYNAII